MLAVFTSWTTHVPELWNWLNSEKKTKLQFVWWYWILKSVCIILCFWCICPTVSCQRDTNLRMFAWTKPEQLYIVCVGRHRCMCGGIHSSWSIWVSHIWILRDKWYTWIILWFRHASTYWNLSDSNQNLHNLSNFAVLWQVGLCVCVEISLCTFSGA